MFFGGEATRERGGQEAFFWFGGSRQLGFLR